MDSPLSELIWSSAMRSVKDGSVCLRANRWTVEPPFLWAATGGAQAFDIAIGIGQLAPAPTFLLISPAFLINIFVERRVRAPDCIGGSVAEQGQDACRLLVLRLQSKVLDVAVLTTLLTCSAHLSLFVGALNRPRSSTAARVIWCPSHLCGRSVRVSAVDTILPNKTVRDLEVSVTLAPATPRADRAKQDINW